MHVFVIDGYNREYCSNCKHIDDSQFDNCMIYDVCLEHDLDKEDYYRCQQCLADEEGQLNVSEPTKEELVVALTNLIDMIRYDGTLENEEEFLEADGLLDRLKRKLEN